MHVPYLSGQISYLIPISANNATLELYSSIGESEVIEDPFEPLDIESDTNSAGFAFAVPVTQSGHHQFSVNGGLVVKESEAFLLGEPFSFSLGAELGESKTSVVELGGDYFYRSADRVAGVSVTLRNGIDAFSATVNDDDLPDGEFTSWVFQAQLAKRLSWWTGSQVIFRTALQLANEPLLAIEKYANGGHSSVRGYRENQLVRDNGITGSVEWRFPLSGVTSEPDSALAKVTLVPFLDWGESWDDDGAGQDDEKLSVSSAGLGFLWQPVEAVDVSLVWGEALEDDVKSDLGDDLQDDGLHFSFRYLKKF